MAVLGAAVVVLAVLVVFNLLITFAVLRRLRSHESLLARGAGARPGTDLVGRTLPEFTAVSTTGATVTNASDTARLVGIFSATCAPCRDQAAAFAAHEDPNRLAIVLMEGAPDADQEAILAALAGSPAIVAEPASVELVAALEVRSFPQILQVDPAGVVVGARHSVRALATSGG